MVDPMKRMTIPEIRQHPWFQAHLPRYLAVPPPDTMQQAKKVFTGLQRQLWLCCSWYGMYSIYFFAIYLCAKSNLMAHKWLHFSLLVPCSLVHDFCRLLFMFTFDSITFHTVLSENRGD